MSITPTNDHRIMQFTQLGSPWFLAFLYQISYSRQGNTPCEGFTQDWIQQIICICTTTCTCCRALSVIAEALVIIINDSTGDISIKFTPKTKRKEYINKTNTSRNNHWTYCIFNYSLHATSWGNGCSKQCVTGLFTSWQVFSALQQMLMIKLRIHHVTVTIQ